MKQYAGDDLFRTVFEPLPDITAYELALDRKFINASDVVSERNFFELGTALRHRRLASDPARSMLHVAQEMGYDV